ncbi:Colicin immunity protein / pyocin immunity protein [Pseudomonas sp. GM79]|uniref:bacteriocin immunity protein n=1 Tax=Pseudomonas sp. GM79 TaxID=1144338 RepID=UPI00026F7288|nr:bacteriocin immunity protein [Pseudomonas sp. GM79]EJN28067.1 Colicin immunity protein / pyocin immunity protein [Pseudomonas sp. GM79]
MILKGRLEDYTEEEFLTFLGEFFHQTSGLKGIALEVYREKLLDHFEVVTEHPGRSDVIFYPKEGQEDSPEGILKEVKEWRAANNKPGFKSE